MEVVKLMLILIFYCFFSGKSSLAVQYVDGHFVDSYYPTIENTFTKTIRYKGQDYLTEIVDTAGQVGDFSDSRRMEINLTESATG